MQKSLVLSRILDWLVKIITGKMTILGGGVMTHVDFVNENRFEEMEELSKSLFGEDWNDGIDNFIEKFWEVVNEEYDYRDMLTFEEIQKIFDHIKE